MEGRCDGKAIIRAVGKDGRDMDLDFNYTLEYMYAIEDDSRLKSALEGKSVDEMVAYEMKGGMTIVALLVPPGYLAMEELDRIPDGYEAKITEWLGRQMEPRGCRITDARLAEFELTEECRKLLGGRMN